MRFQKLISQSNIASESKGNFTSFNHALFRIKVSGFTSTK